MQHINMPQITAIPTFSLHGAPKWLAGRVEKQRARLEDLSEWFICAGWRPGCFGWLRGASVIDMEG